MKPDLSIGIVSWNTRELLRHCLLSLPAAVAGLRVETIVVDNASADGSSRLVRMEFPDCHLIDSGGNLGFARASNLALRAAGGQTLLLLNPDTVCPPGSLAALHAYLLQHAEVGAAGPTLLDADGQPAPSFGDFPQEWMHWAGLLDPRRRWLPHRLRAGLGRAPRPGCRSGPVDYVKGACLLMRREAYQEVGPLDERFFLYFEETDWCLRARACRWQIHHCAEAAITHLEGQSAGQVSDWSLAQFQRSYRLFVAKHYGHWRVPGFRLAQACEYSGKGLLRYALSGGRGPDRALARTYFRIAGLQLRRLEIEPPA